MTQPDRSYRERALDLAPLMAGTLKISTSEARRRITLADDDKLKRLVDAYEKRQGATFVLRHLGFRLGRE